MAESPDYVAPDSRSPSPSALSALFHQVHGAGPSTPATPDNLERGRRSREEEGRRRARARLLLDQDRMGPGSAGGGTSFSNPGHTGRSTGADSEDWVCICRLCKLYPGRLCGTNWPRRLVAKVKWANREEELDEAEKRRCRLASTWTPPRKRSISPQGGTIRCKSPHICRSAATGGCRSRFIDPNPSTQSGRAEISRSRSMTPEGR